MLPNPDELADVVVETVATALGPVLSRMAAAEATLQAIGDVRDRVIVVETKAAQPVDLGDVRDRLLSVELRTPTRELWDALTAQTVEIRSRIEAVDAKASAVATAQPFDVGDVRERLAALEVRSGTAALDLQRQISELEVKAAVPVPVAVPTVPEIAPEDMAASVAGLLRKELADLEAALPVRTCKRVERDARGYTITEEPVS